LTPDGLDTSGLPGRWTPRSGRWDRPGRQRSRKRGLSDARYRYRFVLWAGGSSLGAEAVANFEAPAANHWKTAVEVHQVHFPRARHLLADISQADPRRYPRTDILVASRR